MRGITLSQFPASPYRIGVIADVHFGEDHPGSRRRCSIAEIILERAVRRLNGMVRPDVVLVLGDLVDDGSADSANDRLQKLKKILETLECPYIAIPGNHDGDPSQFFDVFPQPAPWEDIAGVRFMAFVDREEPGYNATRSDADVRRISEARSGYQGPLVALQHVCLFPPGQDVAPYNYTNAEDVIDALKKNGVALSVSGHHHHGCENSHSGDLTFINAPGLCESPFPILEIVLGDGAVTTQRHELMMPEELKLVDHHVHTQLAYCSTNMDVEKSISLAQEFGLGGVTFSEHSGQLYFGRKPYWRNEWLDLGIDGADPAFDRMSQYLELKVAHESEYARFSLEVECDARGNLVLPEKERQHFSYIMGAIHALPGLSKEASPTATEHDRFLFAVESLCKAGIRSLAHPMRVFRRSGWGTPPELLEPTAGLLAKYGVAAELNFHTNEPPVEFVRLCLDRGVKFTFGSDSHSLAEIGDFARNIALLREAGFDGDLGDVVLS